MIPGVDGRSAEARRWRDLCAIFAHEFQIRTDADLALVETAATIKCALENAQALMAKGERLDMQELGRLSAELRGVFADLKRNAQSGGTPGQIANLSTVLIGENEDEEG
jgi:hypothetical protein